MRGLQIYLTIIKRNLKKKKKKTLKNSLRTKNCHNKEETSIYRSNEICTNDYYTKNLFQSELI